MRKYQRLLDEFLDEMSDRNRILAGKRPALRAFAGWLDDREKQQIRRQREASEWYTIPLQAIKIKQAE